MRKAIPTEVSPPPRTRSKGSQTFKAHPAAELLIERADLRESGQQIRRMVADTGQLQRVTNATTATLRMKETALEQARKAAKVTADKYMAPVPELKKPAEH